METPEKTLKKRGRKPKNANINDEHLETQQTLDDAIKPKKRGRKPKGGKIVENILTHNEESNVKPNIILHLKCSLSDVYSNYISDNIDSFNFNKSLSYNVVENNSANFIQEKEIIENVDIVDTDNASINDTKLIISKLKKLRNSLHFNNCNDKKSACFWCTYDFENPPIFIPKFYIRESYHVYGCFCSPECAAAYLMDENIDSSVKFERYYLLNYIYSKIYEYKKSIKPAPDPHHLLDKYCGNLTIQEYRSLFKTDRVFLIVEKPLTRILPELHEDNDDFIINNKIIPSNAYNIKKNIKKINKSDILNDKFGIPS